MHVAGLRNRTMACTAVFLTWWCAVSPVLMNAGEHLRMLQISHRHVVTRRCDERRERSVQAADTDYVRCCQTPKATPGHKPLLHFASELFDSHPRFIQLKSMLMDFFNGEVIDAIHLAGIEHVISISLGPTPPTLNAATSTLQASSSTATPTEDLASLPKVHIRSYTIRLLASGTRIPRVELTPMGPSVDLKLRRHTDPDAEMLKQAMKRPKLRKQDVEKGLGKKKKNLEVDEMGDLRGRIHVGKQDLGKLQTRKMKGLKRGPDDMDVDDEDLGFSGSDDEDMDQRPKKRNAT